MTPEQREAATQAVLNGKTVKDVLADTGIPATTLYKWVHKAKLQLSPLESAVSREQTQPNPQNNAVIGVLTAQLQAASAQLNTTPVRLMAALSARLHVSA